MSRQRMAGQKLDERFGEGFTDRVKGDGLQDPTKQSKYSKKELLAEFRGRDKNVKVDEGANSLVNKYQSKVDSGERFNGQAQEYLKSHGVTFGENSSNENVKTPTPKQPKSAVKAKEKAQAQKTKFPNNNKQVASTEVNQNQNVDQNNDMNTEVNGNNNVINKTQDNSVTQYGGSSRVFNYMSNGKNNNDTPTSAATMGGFYDVDDSHSANAARLDRQISQNNSIQQKMRDNAPESYINPQKLDERIHEREMYSRSKAMTMRGDIFGDMFTMNTPEWKSAKPAKELESPNFEDMYNKYTSF